MAFKNFNFGFLLPVYKNTLKFCLFVLYPTLLLNLVIDSSTERESEEKREREKKRGREREDGNQRLVCAEQTYIPGLWP